MSSDQKTENGHNKSTLQIKQDNKFFNKLLSKENGRDPSFRVTPVAIPFLWESQPGTPKHPIFSGDLSPPPLTPPPSYFYNTTVNPTRKKISRSNLFRFSFPRFNLKKALLLTSSFSSSLSSSSSSSDSSRTVGRRRRFSSCGSSTDLCGHSNFEEEYDDNSAFVVVGDSRRIPGSCFGFRRSSSSNGGCGGFYRRHEA